MTAFTNGAHIKDRKISDVFESFDVQPSAPVATDVVPAGDTMAVDSAR